MPPASDRRDRPLLLAFFCSGAAVLGFELLWVRLLGLVLGAEAFGVLAVLTGFFAGLALGAAAFHHAVRASRRPLHVYAACELAIALYGLLTPWILLRLVDPLPRLIGAAVGDNQSTLALAINLAIAAVLLLPATIPMGVSTAAIVEGWRRAHAAGESHYAVGRFYAANTLGATAGIVASTYWLLPRFGTIAGVIVLASVCLLAASIAIVWSARHAPLGAGRPATAEPRQASGHDRSRRVYLALFATGLAGIGFEAVGTQVLAQIFENTVYTFANVLAVYLVGTSIGAWLYARPWTRALSANRDRCTVALAYGLALSIFAAAALMTVGPAVLAAVAPPGSPYAALVTGEVLVTLMVFLLPTLLMGATFSHLLGQLAERGIGFGYAVNTIAGAIAPFVFGLLLVRQAGYGAAMMAVGLVYLAWFLSESVRRREAAVPLLGALAVGLAVAGLTYTPLVLVRPPEGYQVVAQAQGLHGTVSVSERPFRTAASADISTIRLLQVNQNFLMGGAFGYQEKRIGHLALLMAGSPRDVLFLGVGTGITAGAALSHAEVESVTAVELVPEILEFLPWFADHNADLQFDPKVALHASDARRFLRGDDRTYDLIVGELFHPTVNGVGGLFTREHFAEAARHLKPGGLFVQWLPLYQLAPRELATIVRTFLEVFPDAHSMLGTAGADAALGLLGWSPDTGAPRIDPALVGRRLGESSDARSVIRDGREVFALYMADADALRQYAGAGPSNTDLNGRILFDAPSVLGGEDRAALSRALESLLPYRRTIPAALLQEHEGLSPEEWLARVTPTADAITHFLRGDILRFQTPDGEFPDEALAEYLEAYALDAGLANVRQTLVELAGRHPEMAATIVREMSRRNSGDPGLARAYGRLLTARGEEAVLAILQDYLRGL